MANFLTFIEVQGGRFQLKEGQGISDVNLSKPTSCNWKGGSCWGQGCLRPFPENHFCHPPLEKMGGVSIQGEIITPPPLPPFLAVKAIFSGEGGGGCFFWRTGQIKGPHFSKKVGSDKRPHQIRGPISGQKRGKREREREIERERERETKKERKEIERERERRKTRRNQEREIDRERERERDTRERYKRREKEREEE